MDTITTAPNCGELWRSKRDVAAHDGVSVRTVERRVSAGCRSHRVDGVRRFRISDVERFIDDDLNHDDDFGQEK